MVSLDKLLLFRLVFEYGLAIKSKAIVRKRGYLARKSGVFTEYQPAIYV